jgi:hypothetical protein
MYMNLEDENADIKKQQAANKKNIETQGYPLYPVSEDIYNESEEEENIDPQDTSTNKASGEEDNGDDLDIPGSELDDAEENIGSEDEENNYYSIGGDNHNDLEEDNGE